MAAKKTFSLIALVTLLVGLLAGLGSGIIVGLSLLPHKTVSVFTTVTSIKEGSTLERTVSTTLTKTTIQTSTKTLETATTVTVTATHAFKPLGPTSIVMLIGDLDNKGPNPSIENDLRRRIDTASASGVDTIILVFRTSSIETTFAHLDGLLNYAASKGLGVIPRIVVDSNQFLERIQGDPKVPDNSLPDFTNTSQLSFALNLLRRVILHLEEFPNVVGYQVEWGHYGESWINAAFWNSVSANESFKRFLTTVAPSLPLSEFAWWLNRPDLDGDMIYYSHYLPPTDPRRDPKKVAIFYWYQEWRKQITLNITWSFRCLVKQLTLKPVIGFSYVGVVEVSYVYSADKCADATFSPFTPNPTFRPSRFYLRDGYFQGLQFAELDFDTPYLRLEESEEVIAEAYKRGIVPVIFYPLWSTALKDSDIPRLTQYMKRYTEHFGVGRSSQLLVVVGNHDVGYFGYSGSPPIAVANWHSVDPPGFLLFLEEKKIPYEMVEARVYSPELGNRYRAVVVFAPRDTVDGEFMAKLSRTKSPVFVVFPSFVISTPTRNRPYDVSSAIMGMWNNIIVKGRKVEQQVTGSPPVYQIKFIGDLSILGSMTSYAANHLFSYFRGSFDEVLAEVKLDGENLPVIARIDNIYFWGLDIHVTDSINRSKIFDALSLVLTKAGVEENPR